MPGLPVEELTQLTHVDPHGWSAVSFTDGEATTIIYNPNNSHGRQASDIMHELSHLLLDHDPSQVILSGDGQLAMRSYDGKQEDEANWLGWTLLLPRTALLECASRRLTPDEIAKELGVSTTLAEFRLRMTGVSAQFRRVKKRTRT